MLALALLQWRFSMARVCSTVTATIPNGGTFGLAGGSTGISRPVAESVTGFTVFAPATLPDTVTLYLGSTEQPANAAAMAQAQSGGAAITLAAGKSYPVNFMGWRSIAVVAGANVAADRTFTFVFQHDVG